MKRDDRIWRKLARRIQSGRGSVYFEFAFIAPLALMLVLFAADFCRILHTEQQLEIASRLLADLEAHYDKTVRPDDAGKTESPYQKCKMATRDYLYSSLALESPGCVFCNAETVHVPGVLSPLSDAIKWTKNVSGDGWALKILKTLLSGAINVLTGGSHKYIEDFCFCDQMVGAAVSVKMKSLFPKAQGWYGAYFAGVSASWGDFLAIEPVEEVLEEKGAYKSPRQRRVHRHWMPVLDTVCVPRETFIRKFEKNIDNSVVASVFRKLGGNINNYKKKHTK